MSTTTAKAPLKVHEVTVTHHGNRFAVACVYREARYHIWLPLDEQNYLSYVNPEDDTLYKNACVPYGAEGYYNTRHLSIHSQFSEALISQMLRVAREQDLYTKAAAALRVQQEREQAERDASHRLHTIKQAGPELLSVLKAILAFPQITLRPMPMDTQHGLSELTHPGWAQLIATAQQVIAKAEAMP